MNIPSVPTTASLVRTAMLQNGISRSELSRRTGFKPNSISNFICGNAKSKRGRTAIEKVLGIPIWSSIEEFLIARQAETNDLAIINQTSPSP